MPENEIPKELLIPRPRRGEGSHLLVFFSIALLLHGVLFVYYWRYGPALLRKTSTLIGVQIYKEPPPPPKPKLKPPPKPKPTPVKPVARTRPKPAPLLHIEQQRFHRAKTTRPSEETSNLESMNESKGGSKYGNPEGIVGGTGPIENIPSPKPLPPPPPPKPLIPDHKDPVVLTRCQPPYPELERDQGIEGTVQLLVRVGRQGQIEDVRVTQSSGNSDLDMAAVDDVRGCWRFGPAIQNGQPVEARITFAVVFRLQ